MVTVIFSAGSGGGYVAGTAAVNGEELASFRTAPRRLQWLVLEARHKGPP
jgi:hypothetical protein